MTASSSSTTLKDGVKLATCKLIFPYSLYKWQWIVVSYFAL